MCYAYHRRRRHQYNAGDCNYPGKSRGFEGLIGHKPGYTIVVQPVVQRRHGKAYKSNVHDQPDRFSDGCNQEQRQSRATRDSP